MKRKRDSNKAEPDADKGLFRRLFAAAIVTAVVFLLFALRLAWLQWFV